MSEGPAQFELVEFEHVEAAPGTALLRVAARPARAVGVGPLTLVIHDGEGEHRHPQLPALPSPPGLIRAAFSAPVDDVSRGVMFALELPDGSSERLPAPSRRRSALAGSTDAGGRRGGAESAAAQRRARAQTLESSRLAEAERRAEARRLAVTELERRLQVERERRHASEADIGRLRADREQALADRDEAIADRDAAVADREQAEARALLAAASAGTLEAQVRALALTADRSHESLNAALVEKSSELERVRAAAEVAQARAHASRREVAELDEQLAHAQAQITVLEQALAEWHTESEDDSAQSGAQLAAARARSVEAQAQITVLQEQLAEQRAAAQRDETEHSYDIETSQSRIDSANAELEVARLEIGTLQERVSEHEMTLAELDDVLSRRAAEIEVLRLTIDERAQRPAADAAARIGSQLALDLELADIQAQELLSANASIELLRAQAVNDREQLAQANATLEASERRASAADAALAALATDLGEFRTKVVEQARLVEQSRQELAQAAEQSTAELAQQRERSEALAAELVAREAAASLAAEELLSATEAATQARSEADTHRRRVAELSASLASAQRTMHEASETISTHETEHREIKEALRAETERRVRAEEALLAASADRLLATESVALEASARKQLELRAARLSGERDRLEAQAGTLFARIADEHAQADAQKDILGHLS